MAIKCGVQKLLTIGTHHSRPGFDFLRVTSLHTKDYRVAVNGIPPRGSVPSCPIPGRSLRAIESQQALDLFYTVQDDVETSWRSSDRHRRVRMPCRSAWSTRPTTDPRPGRRCVNTAARNVHKRPLPRQHRRPHQQQLGANSRIGTGTTLIDQCSAVNSCDCRWRRGISLVS